jgi:hypothetical protein
MSRFEAKNSKSRTTQIVPQIPNVLTSSQPQSNIHAFCDLSQQKCAQVPRQYIGDFS